MRRLLGRKTLPKAPWQEVPKMDFLPRGRLRAREWVVRGVLVFLLLVLLKPAIRAKRVINLLWWLVRGNIGVGQCKLKRKLFQQKAKLLQAVEIGSTSEPLPPVF
mgnify:CR=1 FL=1